jgi:hypothetical protein
LGNKTSEQPQGPRLGRLKNGGIPCDLSLLPRCTAMAKNSGNQCKQPAMANGKCHWHGGKSTGAPQGNKNALRHGLYCKEVLAKSRRLRTLLVECKKLLKQVS